MRTYESHGVHIECFDEAIYQNDDAFITFIADNEIEIALGHFVSPNITHPIGTFLLRANKEVKINLSDVVRFNAPLQGDRGITIMFDEDLTSLLSIDYSVVGDASPLSEIRPTNFAECLAKTYGYSNTDTLIVPPSNFFSGLEFGWDVVCSTYLDRCLKNGQKMHFVGYTDENRQSAPIDLGAEWNLTIPSNVVSVCLLGADNSLVAEFKPRKVEKNKIYALCVWKGYTGAYKQMIFEVRDYTKNTNNVTEIDTLNDEYKCFKDREDSLALAIDDITAYDAWYYSDLITSNDVKLLIWNQTIKNVLVTDKSIKMPNGDAKRNDFSVKLKYKRNATNY